MVSTPDPWQGRPVPDTEDLRLLAEIINNGAIGLPQAAWNARMSQAEAAARFVDMAERGLPLRLVAEGDRQLLWRIAQAGPATGGLDLPAGPAPVVPTAADPAPPTPPAAVLPPASAVPPHEQALAGAVPLGQPPFGTPPAAESDPEPAHDEPGATEQRTAEPHSGEPDPGEPEPDPREPVPEPDFPESEPAPEPDIPDSEPAPEPAESPTPDPTHRVMISGRPTQSVVGLSGEHLDISLQQIIDPADGILTSVGYRINPAERALLVQTSIGNPGPVDYESLPDLHLVLIDGRGNVLQKAAMVVAGYPAHRVGVPANTLVSGWTVFLVPAATEVTELRWRVRPDLPDPSVSWGFGPAQRSP